MSSCRVANRVAKVRQMFWITAAAVILTNPNGSNRLRGLPICSRTRHIKARVVKRGGLEMRLVPSRPVLSRTGE